MTLSTLGTLLSRFTLSRRVAVALVAASVLSCVATYIVLARVSNDIDTVYLLLNLDLVLLLMMGTVIAHQIARLWGERRRGTAGARLHVRLVTAFGILAAMPAILMAVFSSLFLYFGIHAWFNDRVSTAIHESLEVAQAYLREHQQVIRADVLAMANDLNREAPVLLPHPEAFDAYMQTQSELRNLPEALVIGADGRVLARSRLSFSLEMDKLPQKALQGAQGGDVVLISDKASDRIRALVRLDRLFDAYLYVGRVVDSNVLSHIRTTEDAVRQYTALQGKKGQLQLSVTVIFVVLALILFLAAVWLGLMFARDLATPIGALIRAAERVRGGDLTAQVAESADDDEISLLGRAFNRMTRQIESQRGELIDANRLLDERRRFTEAVLSGASSGIIGLNNEGVITLANLRAEELLIGAAAGAGSGELIGRHLRDVIPDAAATLDKAAQAPDTPAAVQLAFAAGDGPRRSVFLRVTAEQGGGGAVVTLDDISALASAQRKAAWADVARRIAHEIKNPLTPIQLSAERLKRKYLPQIRDDAETFERCTDIIIRQVNEIGHMVNEFSSYARMPVAVKTLENVVEVLRDAITLQRPAHPDIVFEFHAVPSAITASCDRSQLTQVVTNLLQNAVDSIQERRTQHPEPPGAIVVTAEQKGDNVIVTLADNGAGLAGEIQDQIMEPYVTTKKKGSGLGLAIAKKIMEDHDGSVVVENSVAGDTILGAKATIVFPRGVKP